MSRKRKSDQEPSSETSTAVADVPAVAPPVTEPKPEGRSFAERVGQKKPARAPDPFGIATDSAAGVRLIESLDDELVAIKFGDGSPEQKPSQAVIDRMKEAHFRWHPKHRVWIHPVTPETRRAVRIDAEQLFQEVRQMIRHEKGIEASPEVPF